MPQVLDTRVMRSAFAAFSALAALTIIATLTAQETNKDAPAKEKMEECAKVCHECQRVCDSCGHYCATLVIQGKSHHAKTMRTCHDCAEFCAITARIAARQGVFLDLAASSCATACERCARQCDTHREDATMKQCADECRKCQKICLEILGKNKTEGTSAN